MNGPIFRPICKNGAIVSQGRWIAIKVRKFLSMKFKAINCSSHKAESYLNAMVISLFKLSLLMSYSALLLTLEFIFNITMD